MRMEFETVAKLPNKELGLMTVVMQARRIAFPNIELSSLITVSALTRLTGCMRWLTP